MNKPFDALIPSIEQRESAWIRLKERQALRPETSKRPTITISREFGCEAFPMAERLKALLEEATGESWNIYDKTLVEKVASDEKLSLDLLSHLGDESHAQDVLRTHFGYLTHDEAYAKVVKHLVQVARLGNAIIVGRGGAVVCQDLPHCLHLRLEAGFGFRATTLARRLGVALRDAEDLVRTQSKLREKFISDCLHTDITRPLWYHAVLNNERLDADSLARIALELLKATWSEPSLFSR